MKSYLNENRGLIKKNGRVFGEINAEDFKNKLYNKVYECPLSKNNDPKTVDILFSHDAENEIL